MDEYLKHMLIEAKYKARKNQVGSKKAAIDLKEGLFVLTKKEERIFGNLSAIEIILSMIKKYNIERYNLGESNTSPEAILYPEGVIYLVDDDGREYRDTLEGLGCQLINGVYLKKD